MSTMISNIPLNGQPPEPNVTQEVFETVNAQQPSLSFVSPGDPLVYKLKRVKKNAIRTLYGVFLFHPKPCQILELSEMMDTHRSTISAHVNELEAVYMAVKSILPGTEKKTKPTGLYQLHPSVNHQELREIFEREFPGDPLLSPASEVGTGEEPIAPQTDVELKPNLHESATTGSDDSFQEVSFEQQIAQVIHQMAEEIVALQRRISQLEAQLSQRTQRGADLTQTISLLGSLQTRRVNQQEGES